MSARLPFLLLLALAAREVTRVRPAAGRDAGKRPIKSWADVMTRQAAGRLTGHRDFASYRAVMATPSMEERIMEWMPEEAKAVVLLLGRRLSYEVTKAIDSITGAGGRIVLTGDWPVSAAWLGAIAIPLHYLRDMNSITPATGAIAVNLYQGSRSEYLAQYAFSAFGTSQLVPHQEGYGLDLFCTLTERVGRRAWPYAYYVVQVKSTVNPWKFRGRKSVTWLVDYPAPLFYCVVSKRKAQMRVYQTSARFLAREPLDKLDLIPERSAGEGKPAWGSAGQFPLGPPILEFTVNELADRERLAHLGEVLRAWVVVDQANVRRRQMGMWTTSVPRIYTTNEVPKAASGAFGVSTFYGGHLTPEIRAVADEMAVEVVDSAGTMMLDDGDWVGAVLAGMLCFHLDGEHLPQPGKRWPLLYSEFSDVGWLIDAVGGYVSDTFPFEKLLSELRRRLSLPERKTANEAPWN